MPVMSPVAGSVPAGQPAVSLKDKYFRSNRESLDSLTMLLYGPSGVGKTIAAATVSAKFPTELGKESAYLDDTFFVSYDKDGTQGLLQFGVEVPTVNVLDAITATGLDVLAWERQELFPLLKELYQSGIRRFVFDTLSARAEMMSVPVKVMADGSKMDYWTLTSTFNTEFWMQTAKFPGTQVVYVGHSKYKETILGLDKKMPKDIEEAKLKVKNEAIDPYKSEVTLQIPGNTGEVFFKQASLVAALKGRIDPKSRRMERTFIIEPGSDVFRSKNRFAHVLDPEEKAHISNMMTKYQSRILAKLDNKESQS